MQLSRIHERCPQLAEYATRYSENEAIRTRIEAANTSAIRAKHNSQCIENERGAAAVFAARRELLGAISENQPSDSGQIHPTTLLDIVGGAECGNIPPFDRRDLEVLNNPPQW
jgi:hypothetical protein